MKAKQNILLATSTTHGISDLIEKNLIYCGFNVINISRNDRETAKFEYPSLFSRINVFIQRNILGNRRAKVNLQSKLLQNELVKIMVEQNISYFDYSLFFLAQNYSEKFLNFVKTKTKKGNMINYQWDGVRRFPYIFSCLSYFDRKFVFDPDDIRSYSEQYFLPTTSFYFDFDLKLVPIEYDFYFVGAHRDDRLEKVNQFARFAKERDWKLNFNIISKSSEKCHHYEDNISCISEEDSFSFEKNLDLSRRSRVLVDFVISEHQGLSLRTFEALGHNKKLITTNKYIKNYDFYHPNNIFILTENNFNQLEIFLEKPYFEINEIIKQKYSFTNWVHYILDIPPYIPIDLPRN